MARPVTVEDEALIESLSRLFRDVGYSGASLAELANATGLSKAALYHRFPGGKQQMADEVMAATAQWLEEYIFGPLAGAGSPQERLRAVARRLDQFYDGGRKACLLNMFSSPASDAGPFAAAIKATFERLITAFARVAREAGLPAALAKRRAERTVTLLHGSLVLARGLASSAPFKTFLAEMPADLLAAARAK